MSPSSDGLSFCPNPSELAGKLHPMKIRFYGGPLDGEERQWPKDAVPDEWEEKLPRHPRRRTMYYRRYTWPDDPARQDVFVAEGYEGGFHMNMHGEIE